MTNSVVLRSKQSQTLDSRKAAWNKELLGVDFLPNLETCGASYAGGSCGRVRPYRNQISGFKSDPYSNPNAGIIRPLYHYMPLIG